MGRIDRSDLASYRSREVRSMGSSGPPDRWALHQPSTRQMGAQLCNNYQGVYSQPVVKRCQTVQPAVK